MKPNPVDRQAVSELVERLALAALGMNTWPNPWARKYHRKAIARAISAMTARDVALIGKCRAKIGGIEE